jgi:hypothetical protein
MPAGMPSISKFKQFRAAATRYDKRERIYQSRRPPGLPTVTSPASPRALR